MQMNAQGMALIKLYEGYRARAYRDAVGVLTIGFGHTSMAGAPAVREGMEISKAEALRILENDVGTFATGVRRLVAGLDLNSNQFSALVSFAYNVGLDNFRNSSVYRAVLHEDWMVVPRRLALWVMAGGQKLNGLVKRREAEARLCMKDPLNMTLFEEGLAVPSEHELAEMNVVRGAIDQLTGKSLPESTTVWATLAGAAAGVTAAVREITYTLQDVSMILPTRYIAPVVLVMIIAACATWVINERRKKAVDDGI